MRASQEGHAPISRLLIAAQADVNRKNNEGMNALMLASQRGHSEMALLLLKAGAVIDEQTSQGSTALMLACKRGHEKVVEVLVSMGAELYIRDSRRRCARDTAEKRHHYDLLRWLDTQVQVASIQEYRSKQRHFQFKELKRAYERGSLRLKDDVISAIGSLQEPPLSAAVAVRSGGGRHPSYVDWQWPQLVMRCLELPLGVFELIIDMLPKPRIWHWSLWCE